jgi:hypothetical protein
MECLLQVGNLFMRVLSRPAATRRLFYFNDDSLKIIPPPKTLAARISRDIEKQKAIPTTEWL